MKRDAAARELQLTDQELTQQVEDELLAGVLKPLVDYDAALPSTRRKRENPFAPS